ncbi:MAG: epoxyqueuosine reductase QueH, partial [Desulfocapsaceae bacterium]
YSTYQNHALIIKQAQSAAEQGSVALFYRDFRDGWQQGIDAAIACGLYRQSYCGCIFSEQERYDNRLKKRLKKERKNHV